MSAKGLQGGWGWKMVIFADVHSTVFMLTYWVGGLEKVQKYADVIKG